MKVRIHGELEVIGLNLVAVSNNWGDFSVPRLCHGASRICPRDSLAHSEV